MKPYYQDNHATIYNCDCEEVLPELPEVDLVLTDPPYPDWMAKEYNYNPNKIIKVLNGAVSFVCFWTAKEKFLVEYDRVHIWDKKVGCGSQYERIYEKNYGDKNWCVYNYYLINSTVAASYSNDIFNIHKAQKPIKLIKKLIVRGNANTILDPFMGSGTTLLAAKDLNKKVIGIETVEKYCEIAANRMCQEVLEL